MKNEISFSARSLTELIQSTVAKGASFRFQVKGSSMAPFINDSDIVTISPLSDSRLMFGRPVAFVRPETKKLVIHRIVGINSDSYFIKGDNSPEADGLISKENILGAVTGIERESRRFVFGLGSERVLIALLSRGRILNLIYSVWAGIPFTMRRFIKRRILYGIKYKIF